MAGQMTLVYIILRHNQEQAQCYQIDVNLLHCALTERKPRGEGGGGLYELFVQSKRGNEQP